MLPLHLGILNS